MGYLAAMPKAAKGHIEQLPSGSFRVSVYGGIDPLTRQEIRLRSTARDELQAQIELGRLLKEASEGRTPETGATVARLMDEYAPIAEWGVSTRQTNEGFIRRTIKPALGHLKVREVRGPILDQLYTRLKRCGDLSCTGRPFTEHRNVPDLTINPHDSRPAWQQVSETLAEAIRSGLLAPGDELPSITELSALQAIGTGVIRHAMTALAADGLIMALQGPRHHRLWRTQRRSGTAPETPWPRPRLPSGRVPSARLPSHEAQHNPRYSRHSVRRVRRRAAVGVDRPESGRVSQASYCNPSAHPGHVPRRRRQGHSRSA